MTSIQTSSRSPSARPEITAALETRTGLDDEVLRELVHAFYGKIRKDPVLGPIFAARIDDWPVTKLAAGHFHQLVDPVETVDAMLDLVARMAIN